jgi:hypothetical protein
LLTSAAPCTCVCRQGETRNTELGTSCVAAAAVYVPGRLIALLNWKHAVWQQL